jgi:hypothetical protein
MFLLPLKELRIRSRWQGNLDDMLELQNKMHWLMNHAKLLGYEVEVLLELGSRLMGLGRVHRPCERPRQASGMFALAAWSGIYEKERNGGGLVRWPVPCLLLAVRRIFPGILATV